MVWRDETHGHNMLRCNNRGCSSHSHNWIEISTRQSVRKVAEIVSEKRTDQCKVGAQRRFNQVALSVDFDSLLALLNDRAKSSWR